MLVGAPVPVYPGGRMGAGGSVLGAGAGPGARESGLQQHVASELQLSS